VKEWNAHEARGWLKLDLADGYLTIYLFGTSESMEDVGCISPLIRGQTISSHDCWQCEAYNHALETLRDKSNLYQR
jgi:hypothetical protein